jgi:hypothetical protein
MAIKIGRNQFAEIFNPITYAHYLNVLDKLVHEKKTSGPDQSEEKISATAINLQRMKRIIKDTTVDPELVTKVSTLEHCLTWLVITEAWCGDAAQNLPVLNKIASLSKNKVQMMLVFRDENPQLMNYFLTNGTRSIPKLICLNSETHEVLATWGPRPTNIQNILNKYKIENPNATHKDTMYHLHLNYFHDKGHSLQAEILKMLEDCKINLQESEINHA